MIITRLLTLYFFACLAVLNAQEYEIKSLPINNNGGSNSIKNKIIFDEDEVPWYNTHNGMVKEFESSHIFYPFMDGKDVVSVQKTSDILLDSKGQIWVTTEEGVFRSDTSKENFQKLHWPVLANINQYSALMAEDCYGNIWMAISKTQVLKIISDTEFKVYETAEVAPQDQDNHLHVVNVYHCDTVILQRGLNCFVITKDTQVSKVPVQYKFQISDSKTDFEVLENGDVFPKDFEGFYKYNGEKFRVSVLETSDLQIIETPLELSRISRVKNPILKEQMDFVFFGVDDILERKFGFLKLVKEHDDYHLRTVEEISFNYVIESFKIANNGIIYISVFDQIHKVRFKNKGFKKGLFNQKDQGKRINISTRDFFEISEHEFLVATYEGFFQLNLSSSKNFINETIRYSYYKVFRAYSKVNDSIVLAIGESALLKLNHKHNRAKLRVYEKDFPENNRYDIEENTDFGRIIFYDIEKYTDSTYILATDMGLGVYNITDEELRPYNLFPLASDTAKFVRDVNYHGNTLYFSTQTDGLFIQNTITNEVSSIIYKENQEGLSSNYVYTSFIDDKGNLWVGTDKGITSYNKELEKRFTLDKQNGLLDENIVGIQQDKLGNIWFSTYKGLYKYSPELKTVFSYFKEDGLTDNEFNQNSYYTATDGTLFFGGVNGVVAFDTIVDNTQTEIKILPVKAEYFDSKKKKDTIATHIENAKNYIGLDTKNSSVSVTFSINDFFNIENNRYLYKVEGLSDEWENLGSQNTLKLFSIPPGNYTLKVKGLNSKGIPSSNELSYDIYVPQVWYKTTRFVLASILTFIGILIGIVIYNATKRKKRYRIELMLIELEQRALRAQMNPHFIFNTLNGMHKKLVKSTSEEVEDYIVSFSEFLRYTLDIGRRELIFLSKEMQYINSYIDLLNYGDNNIKLNIKCDATVDQNRVKIPSMIIQPIVENAVVHGFPNNKTDKQIHLRIQKSIEEQQVVEVVIEDNGIGINASIKNKAHTNKSHQSYATQIVNERFELLNRTRKANASEYKLTVEDISNELQSGTRVTIRIPYL